MTGTSRFLRDFTLPASCKVELWCLGILLREKLYILPVVSEQLIGPVSRAKHSKQKLLFYAI